MRIRSNRSLAASVAAAGLTLWTIRRRLRAMRHISFEDRVVVITGGSRGLGLVLARELAAEGAIVVLLARDEETLQQAVADIIDQGGRARGFTCDVTDRHQVQSTIDEIVEELGWIDVLINDAGIIDVGPLDHMMIDDFDRAMDTHFRGPLYTTLAALPHMRRGGARRIVNISSIGGRIAVPHLLPYSASKFALTGLSEGLRAELARQGFLVTTVCPGLMRTGSTYNARFKGQHRREFAWFHISGSLPLLSIDARRAAHQIIEACRRGDAMLTLTLPARLAVFLQAVTPGFVAGVMSLANRLLPRPTDAHPDGSFSGWQSVSSFVPSPLTTLSDRAAASNNEVSGRRGA